MRSIIVIILLSFAFNCFAQVDKIKVRKNDTTFLFQNDSCNFKIIIDKSIYGKNLEFVFYHATGLTNGRDLNTFHEMYMSKRMQLSESNIRNVFTPLCKLGTKKLSAITITKHIITINTANKKGFDALIEYSPQKN